MPLRKIADAPPLAKPCPYPDHNPPQHMLYQPGVYEWTCPHCGEKVTFTVAHHALDRPNPEVSRW